MHLFILQKTAQKLELNAKYSEETADRGSLQTNMKTRVPRNSQTRFALDLDSMQHYHKLHELRFPIFPDHSNYLTKIDFQSNLKTTIIVSSIVQKILFLPQMPISQSASKL